MTLNTTSTTPSATQAISAGLGTINQSISAALASLAGHCDGAQTRDGQGFSQPHASLGRYLAQKPIATWTEDDTAIGAEFCRHYHGQLASYGVDVSGVLPPTHNQANTVLAAARQHAADVKQRAAEAAAAAAKIEADSKTGLWLRSGTLTLIAPGYDGPRVAAARAIPSRSWNGTCDTFAPFDLAAVEALCARFALPVRLTEDDRAQLATAATAAAARAAAAAVAPQVTLSGKHIVFKFAYDENIKDKLKTAGAIFDSAGRYWYMSAAKIGPAIAAAQSCKLRISPELLAQGRQAAAEEVAQQQRLVAARGEALAAKDASLPPLVIPGIITPLMPHQSAPVRMLALTARLLIADAPGLGKTLTSIAALFYRDSKRSIIVCPSSLTGNWVKEFAQHTDGSRKVWVMSGTKPEPVPDGVDVVVLGWSVLSARSADLRDWKPDALIVDEAHYGKSGGESARAKAATSLATTVRKQGGMVLLLTGTPVVNRPVELLPLLQMLGAEGQFGGASEYKERYCGPRWQNIGYGQSRKVYDGATNTEELHQKLNASGLYIRRTKGDLVKSGQMGGKYVNGVSALDLTTSRAPVGIDLDAAGRAAYDRAVKDFRSFVEDLIGARAAADGKTLTPSEFSRRVTAATGNILPQIGYVRQVLGVAKVSAVVQRAQQLVGQGEQVVIVAHHREVVDALETALNAVKIQGGMSVKAVEEAKRKFNAREVMVMVLALEAGKTGHTLCLQRINGKGPECARMLIAEESWAPGDEEQAQDRLWRIGQTRDVQVENLTARGTMDFGILQLREQKRNVVSAVVDGTELEEDKLQIASFITGYLMRD